MRKSTVFVILAILCVLLAAFSICSASDRVISQSWDASVGFSQQMDVGWFAADSLDYTHRARYGSAPIILTNAGQVVVWEVMGKVGTSKQTNTYLVVTGAVQSAAGVVKFSVSPAQANLTTGFYTGYVRSFIKTGTNLDHNLVLAYQNIAVSWSPASSNYTLVTPLAAPEWYAYTNVMQSASGTIQRVFNKSSRVEEGASNPQVIEFYQAESVRLNESITQNGSPFDLRGTNTVFVWEITGLKYTNVFVAAAGRAINAAAGQLRFEIAPEDSNLLPGKYLGFVRSMQQGAGNTLSGGAVLACQTITVQGSPDSRYYPIRGPLTYSIEFSTEAITNYFWEVLIAVSGQVEQVQADVSDLTDGLDGIKGRTNFWDTAYGWGNHALAGYLTSFTELDPSWHSGTGAIWTAIGSATPGGYAGVSNAAMTAYLWGNHATNGYLTTFTELDPAWHSGTGTLWTAIDEVKTNDAAQFAGLIDDLKSLGDITNSYCIVSGFPTAAESRVFTFYGLQDQGSGDLYPVYKNGAALIYKDSVGGQYVQWYWVIGISGSEFASSAITDSYYPTDGVLTKPGGATITNDFISGPVAMQNLALAAEAAARLAADTNALYRLSSISQRVERVVSGTDAFEGILLDREIKAWEDIGLTYTNAVRLNSEIIITNDSVWTGWTTTGDLLTNGAIFLTEGEYLQSPVQSNGVSSYSFGYYSDMGGTAYSADLLDGTNLVLYPYAGSNAVLKIVAESPLPMSTPGVSISNMVIKGYVNLQEAAQDKMVDSLKVIDPPISALDTVNKLYSDAGDSAQASYTDTKLAAYDSDDTKTVRGAQLRLNQSWQAVTANGQEWILSCGEISGDGQLVGTSNYFALAQNDTPLLTFSSDETGLHINSYSITYPDSTNRIVTLNIATNGVLSAPFAEYATNLVVGSWSHVQTYSSNTYPTAVGSNYVLKFTAPTRSKGFFRAMQPAGQSRITVVANIFDLGSNVAQNVKSITFTNGWKIVCTATGLSFTNAP